MRNFRFVHVAVAAALAAAAASSVGLIRTVNAQAGGSASSFVPIVPCRLVDTRHTTDHVGARATAVGENESVVFSVWGSNGNCEIPTTATGIATNITAVFPTADSYLTVYPSDAPRPTASNLNWVAASPPTPNQVTVGLSADGAIGVYNHAGTVDVVVDIVGYYQAAVAGGDAGLAGAVGPQGPAGPAGAAGQPGSPGAPGTPGRSALDPLPSGTVVTGAAFLDVDKVAAGDLGFTIELPFTPTAGFEAVNIIFKAAGPVAAQQIGVCTGTTADPVAPSGFLCLYLQSWSQDVNNVQAGLIGSAFTRDIKVTWNSSTPVSGQSSLTLTWAYTAP